MSFRKDTHKRTSCSFVFRLILLSPFKIWFIFCYFELRHYKMLFCCVPFSMFHLFIYYILYFLQSAEEFKRENKENDMGEGLESKMSTIASAIPRPLKDAQNQVRMKI